MAKKCEKCNGAGSTIKVDIAKAKKMKLVCSDCKGTGEVRDTADGPRIGVIYAPTIFFQMIRNGNIVATLEARQRPILNENGVPLVKKNKIAMFRRDKEVPREYLEIARMTTEPEYRNQGIMTELLCLAAGNKNLEWIETLWRDSTDEGRKFLLSHGFRHEGHRLVWEKTNEQKFPTGSSGTDDEGAEQRSPTDISCGHDSSNGGCVHDADSKRKAVHLHVSEGPALT